MFLIGWLLELFYGPDAVEEFERKKKRVKPKQKRKRK
tara:strand:+ start:84 stop:194 length:111 start_codon:yes stop_codon:yes gene_type:complete